MRKLTALVMATTLVLGSVQLASAADSTADSTADTAAMAPRHGEMRHHPKQGPMMEHMFKDLKLTEQQRQQMRDIARESMKTVKRPPAEQRQQMHDLIATDSFDTAKAQSLVDSMAPERNQHMLANLEMQNKMYNVLTAEQKAQFNKDFMQRSEKISQKDVK
ncbi:ATP-independent periplasmic protein-refolding chaperone Spy [Acerihabitans sp. TG2]|uniref:ATP-independent periplasmic protein-refolding chaperone Spy n=1 Tax=Acerihabitans sp. TG2 TaxID=3096008 RepID=UPI002B22A880|nr:ATP-independent periplasmic protein-refolding chaperone Spy [Acerihabitans sp. TG2]MEA9391059.1 ATP-independent periplasmic protein-refolding chaperone Spy [Acerihabitans sp. TG2]